MLTFSLFLFCLHYMSFIHHHFFHVLSHFYTMHFHLPIFSFILTTKNSYLTFVPFLILHSFHTFFFCIIQYTKNLSSVWEEEDMDRDYLYKWCIKEWSGLVPKKNKKKNKKTQKKHNFFLFLAFISFIILCWKHVNESSRSLYLSYK